MTEKCYGFTWGVISKAWRVVLNCIHCWGNRVTSRQVNKWIYFSKRRAQRFYSIYIDQYPTMFACSREKRCSDITCLHTGGEEEQWFAGVSHLALCFWSVVWWCWSKDSELHVPHIWCTHGLAPGTRRILSIKEIVHGQWICLQVWRCSPLPTLATLTALLRVKRVNICCPIKRNHHSHLGQDFRFCKKWCCQWPY